MGGVWLRQFGFSSLGPRLSGLLAREGLVLLVDYLLVLVDAALDGVARLASALLCARIVTIFVTGTHCTNRVLEPPKRPFYWYKHVASYVLKTRLNPSNTKA